MHTSYITALIALGIASAQTPTKQVHAVDPAFQMTAYSWTIPSNWTFDSTIMPGSSCIQTPFPVFRMISPDGITELKALPRFDWTWATGSGPKLPAGADCLPFNRALSASEFLKVMVGVLGVNFVSEVPPPHLAEYRESLKNATAQAAAGPMKIVYSGDQARFLVRYNVNSVPVDEYLSVTTRCTENTHRFGANQVQMTLYACSAILTRGRTRQGQLEAMQPHFETIGKSVTMDSQWVQKWQSVAFAKLQDQTRRGTEIIHNMYVQAQAMRQRQHEEFMATMQRGTDMSMQRTQDSMNARSRMAGDWADYALDLQKRQDPVTGAITKDSSQYSYTWINESGQRYQTNNPNDNPNGRGTGNWVLQQNVR